MLTRGIREFVSRDWEATRAAKDLYWAARIARLGPLEGLRIADELRRQALAQNSAWPTPADRDQDLLSHVHVAGLLRRASAARRA